MDKIKLISLISLFLLFCYSFVYYIEYDQTSIEPTRNELIEHGFYVYVLPQAETFEQPSFYIYSWTRHCNPSADSRSNPITVHYQQARITLTVGPWGVIDAKIPTKKVEITNSWFKNSTAEYNAQGTLSFMDKFGNPIQIRTGNLSVTETIRLVNKLEYLGPPPETMTTPWDSNNCNDFSPLEKLRLFF